MREEPEVVYQLTEEGWIRWEYARQCPQLVLMERCQGIAGHEGEHWHYRPDGGLVRSEPDGGCSMVSPPHGSWVSPRDMAHLRWSIAVESSIVTDPAVIAELEKDKAPESHAAIDRPMDVCYSCGEGLGHMGMCDVCDDPEDS